MPTHFHSKWAISVLFLLAFWRGSDSVVAEERLRVVILTDISGDPDDQQSLVRFLTYANCFDIEGLIATTSCWKREDPDVDAILQVIDAYEEVQPNLLLHAKGYPTAEHLRKVTKRGIDGYGMETAAKQLGNEAVAHIIAILDKPDARPVWFCTWGGGNTLGTAVMKIRRDRSRAEVEAMIDKLRGYEIALQDDGFAYIAHHFPSARLISAKLLWKGISRTTPTFNRWPESWGGDNTLFDADWVLQNVQKGHGPLGEQYPNGVYLFEGDTPSFLCLVPNGLHCPEHVHYGGWGGRFESKPKRNVISGTGHKTIDQSLALHRDYLLFSDAKDTWTCGDQTYDNEYCTVFRWREAFQNDFAARMDWCVKPYAEANHHPAAVVNGDRFQRPIEMTVSAGDKVTLDASSSTDADDDALTFNWFIYREAGTYTPPLEIRHASSALATVNVPRDAGGKIFHVILTLSDDGEPSLTSYRRVIVTVE